VYNNKCKEQKKEKEISKMTNNFNVNRIQYTDTMWKIIRKKDLATAKAHYDACTSRSGRAMWWNVIEQIWRNSAKINKVCQKWHVDRIHKEVMERVEGCDSGNYVYWIRLIDDMDVIKFDKFGTAEDLVRRWGTLFQEAFIKPNNIVRYKVMRVWDCGNQPFMNEEMEAFMKRHAVMTYGMEHYVPNDRFDCRLSPKLVDAWANEFFTKNNI
jgi:hypothetical protein